LAPFLLRNPVWILAGLKWEKDPRASNQSFAGGSVPYFGGDGEFGIFGAIILRQNGSLALATARAKLSMPGDMEKRK
jgi:hypothetical protein